MKTVTLGIANRHEVSARFLSAMKGEVQGAYITFDSPDLLFQMLTPLRWRLLKSITGAGPLPIREIARRVDRDVNAVRREVLALQNAGLLDRVHSDLVEFPYDVVHVDFRLGAS